MDETKIIPVLMPKWGLSMKQGILAGWLVEEGTRVAVGDEIMEVETDKIASAVEAADAGILRRCVARAGETYPVRALMGVMAPEEVQDADIDAFIANYETPQDADDEEADAAAHYAFIDLPQGRVRYAQHGQQGPALILIHGFGGDLDNWLFNIDALAQHTRLYALDLPGHGQSVKTINDPSLTGLAESLQAFMDELGIEQAHLVGHSMGAVVAATLACNATGLVQSLSLISAAGLGPEINPDYIDGFVNAGSRRELKPVLLNLFADTELVNRTLVDDLLKYKRIDGVQDTLQQLSANLFAHGTQQCLLAERISELPLSTLVVWGTEDKVIPATHAQNIKTAKVELIENAGHMVQMEQAGRINELILDHILD